MDQSEQIEIEQFGKVALGDGWQTASVRDSLTRGGYRTVRVRRTSVTLPTEDPTTRVVLHAAATGEVFGEWPDAEGIVQLGHWTPKNGACTGAWPNQEDADTEDTRTFRRAVQEARGEIPTANVQDVADVLTELLHPLQRSEALARTVAGLPSLLAGIGPDRVYRALCRVRRAHVAADRLVARVLPGRLGRHLRDVHGEVP